MGIPAEYTWALVLTDVGDFLSNPLVQAAIIAVIALAFAPRVIRTLRRATSGR